MYKIFFFCILCSTQIAYSQIVFDNFFHKSTLRIDFTIGGNNTSELVMLQQIKKEPYWGGSTTNLIDTYEQGDYRYLIFDAKTNELVFSRGFSSLFSEWVTTEEAKKINRSFYQVNTAPFPKNKAVYQIQSRNKFGEFKTIFTLDIDPDDIFIKNENIEYEVVKIKQQKESEKAVDIVFLAEGYTENQMDKFISDANRFVSYILETEPFNLFTDFINFYAIKTPSEEEGTDLLDKRIFKNTIFESTFFTLGAPRYLTVKDIKKIYDASANVPYDHIYVLVNTETYGGGAFYNHYSCCGVDNALTQKISSHELMHGLIGLMDEYYNYKSDEVGYKYELSVEPWHANITTLVDFEKKWPHLVDNKTPIPTPRTTKYKNKVGVFEGGAYTSKGIYSPMQDCKMKSNNTQDLCPVCKEYTIKILDFLIGKK